MNKGTALSKAKWLSNLLEIDYCVVKYFYGYDAESFSGSIPKKDIYLTITMETYVKYWDNIKEILEAALKRREEGRDEE